ncbi:hypothetical protein ABB37_00059 [Leptomonas pyrrhocoris]|uniref:Uncharacterized protein n=1 Tax=Leptomonas pyrrhocoris TaxID=157538 RepID=A0A0M9G9Q5_LEPPY|nr:hypothetical protein ABB37_00059 [Leptomonas pyrrhocoris]XP_015664106.1 hypothetical protein ABB37_00059 [Leptomonas pyrrhocoris]KPA85666.1 hypothetical protein ABB37_00059 [Leptomonas pyrrhocoris]KPA85667.1 hypothetical protein ABB37_00059 [Leptomonas pyrrhocoris]|eukprot:XP_015664105.1 hypothetical protein ABB37_00059 [Leptomonas pyrrhocoris]
MACVISTADAQYSSDVVCSIIAKDAYTLLFVLSASAAAADRHAAPVAESDGGDSADPFGYRVFSSRTSPTSSTAGEGVSAASDQGNHPTIREYLWAHVAAHRATQEISPSAFEPTSRGAPLPCLCCCLRDVHSRSPRHKVHVPPSSSTESRERNVASATIANAFAELRATEYLAATAATAGPALSPAETSAGSPDSTTGALRGAGTPLRRLHVVRHHGEGGFIDVWCVFECGCCALATFALALMEADSRRVRLHDCVWVPRPINCAKEQHRLSSSVAATGSTLERSSSLTEAATTALICPLRSTTNGCAEGKEMLILTPHRPADDVAPKLHFVRLRCGNRAAADIRLSGSAASARDDKDSPAMQGWRLHAQGWFYLDELFRVPPSLTRPTEGNEAAVADEHKLKDVPHGGASEAHALSNSACVSLRSVRWLPDALDCSHGFPLLAVLYAAPALSIGDSCLDTLSVCCLVEDESDRCDARHPNRESVMTRTVTDVTDPPPIHVSGRVLMGPWSVRGLTLAHPSFLFAATLGTPLHGTGLASKQSAENGERAMRRGSERGTAADAFRSTRRAMTQAPTEIVGVFQRPAQEPYAASRLFRAARRHSHKVDQESAEVVSNSEPAQWDQKRSEGAFAFVLYGAAGEVARCALDGYPECASTVLLAHDAFHNGGDPRTAADGGVRAVARIGALFAGSTAASAAEGGYTAVLLTIVAQPIRRIRGLAADVVASNRRAFAPDSRKQEGACRYSVQLTQRVRVDLTGLPRSPSSLPSAATAPLSALVSVDQMLHWTTCGARSNRQRGSSGDSVCMLICGYAACREGSVDVVHEGVFALSSVQTCISPVDDKSVVTAAAATPETPPPPFGTVKQDKKAKICICAQGVSAIEFARSCRLCSSMDSTSMDVLSHSPLSVVGSHALPSTALPSNVLPVALAWVHSTPRNKDGFSSGITSVGCELAACVELMDVVALLRSGDVVGWRCDTEAPRTADKISSGRHEEALQLVLRLGTLQYAKATNTPSGSSPTQRDRETKFLQVLLNEGAGPADASMKVVVTRKNKETHAAAVLLVIAAGPLVGVVRLADGHVERVIDVRTANTKSVWTSSTSVSTMQLEQLPVTEPYSCTSQGSGVEGCGETFSFLWTGVLTSDDTAAEQQQLARDAASSVVANTKSTSGKTSVSNLRVRRRVRTMTCVLQLGVVSWADIAASHACVANADGAALCQLLRDSIHGPSLREDGQAAAVGAAAAASRASSLVTFTPPPSIVLLQNSIAWFGEEVASGDAAGNRANDDAVETPLWPPQTSKLCPFFGWFNAASKANEVSATETEREARLPTEAASLCVCDAALLHTVWPGRRFLSEKATVSEEAVRDESGLCPALGYSSNNGQQNPFIRRLRWSWEAEGDAASTKESAGENMPRSADALLRQLLCRPLRVAPVPLYNADAATATAAAARLLVVRLPRLVADMDWATKVSVALDRENSDGAGLNFTDFALQQVLYITSLTGPAALRDSLHSPVSASLHNLVLCTLLLTESDVTRSASLASTSRSVPRDRLASFLLCGIPSTPVDRATPSASLGPAARSKAANAGVSGVRLTWHWIPLPPVEVNSEAVPVGVTRVLPTASSPSLLSSPAHRAANALSATQETVAFQDRVCVFYCEGVTAATAANPSPLFVQSRLVIRHAQLCATLASGCMSDSDRRSADDAESVFAYVAVDPALICWQSISRSDVCE